MKGNLEYSEFKATNEGYAKSGMPPAKDDVEQEDTISEENISRPYDPSRINVVRQEMPVFQVMRKVESGEINLQPDFQRDIVWDDVRKSKLIESILIRIPLPSFYLDAIDDDEWLVVDGLQRLSTLYDFIKDKFSLSGLEFLGNEIDKKTFTELSRSFQRRIEETPLFLYLIRPETPLKAKLTIFRRINTGGMVLSPQEIRHCLFQGKTTQLLKELASSGEFLEVTTNSIPPKRMDDRECVLRFCTFYLTPYTDYQEPDLDAFLGGGMEEINKMEDEEIKRLEVSFKEAMLKAKEVFGQHAFRKIFEEDAPKNPINKSLFEIWSVSLQKYSFDLLKANKDKIRDRFIKKMNSDSYFVTSITQGTGGVKRVHKRFSTAEDIIKEALK